jgi:hypothetical protein
LAWISGEKSAPVVLEGGAKRQLGGQGVSTSGEDLQPVHCVIFIPENQHWITSPGTALSHLVINVELCSVGNPHEDFFLFSFLIKN